MSVKSFNQQRSSFTPYQNSLQQKQLSLFSRLNLNQNDKNSLQQPLRNFAESQFSELYSMRSRKRKGSAQLQLKQSLPGNRTYLNVSLVGKSSLIHHDLFGHEHYQDLGLGQEYYDQKKQFSQKSCPVCPSYNIEQQSEQQQMRFRQIESQIKPRFHKTKNLLRTIANYLHKFILHNKRSNMLKQKYFRKILLKQKQQDEKEDYLSLQAFANIKIEQESQNLQCQNEMNKKKGENKRKGKQGQNKNTNRKQTGVQVLNKSKNLQEKQSCNTNQKRKEPKTEGDGLNKQVILKQEKQKQKQSKNQQEQYKVEQQHLKNLFQKQIQQKISQFNEWISSLSVINFSDYERIWTQDHQFSPLYRQICYKYYKQEVYCDIMRSRLTTKQITNKYMNQLITGLFNPKQFYRFR